MKQIDCYKCESAMSSNQPWFGVYYCQGCNTLFQGLIKQFPPDAPTMERVLQKTYAKHYGYFWSPCPLCDEHFGGHEEHGGSTPTADPNVEKIICINCKDKSEAAKTSQTPSN